MVGWNVAMMQLATGRIIHKISILDYLISANCILLFNENDEHAKCLNVWFCFCCMVTMYACFTSKHFSFLCVYVHGASFPNRQWYGSVLFAGRRVGDVTPTLFCDLYHYIFCRKCTLKGVALNILHLSKGLYLFLNYKSGTSLIINGVIN